MQLANDRGAADIHACMHHKGAATQNLINVDISSRRHIGYAIIAKCSASAQAIAGALSCSQACVWPVCPSVRLACCLHTLHICSR